MAEPSATSARTGTARTLVVGLGNPLLGDDGVGWKVIEEVERALAGAGPPGVELDALAVGGLRLMERLTGYDVAILVDAAALPGVAPGTVGSWTLDELPDGGAGHLDSAHDASLRTALGLGRSLGATLPERVFVVTVQGESLFEFREEFTPAVAAAIPAATRAVLELLAARG